MAPAGMDRGVPRLFRSVRPEPVSPLAVPPIVKELVVQVTLTLVTLADPTVPVGLATVQVWLGLVGWVATVTEYAEPLGTAGKA